MKKLECLLAVLLCTAACNSDFGGDPDFLDSPAAHGEIVLGEQLEDPYSVDNINAAVTKLYGTKGGRTQVEATDLYVRFLPRSKDDLDLLESMGLQLTDHPLDYEIVREGDWYHDPKIPEDDITWQYAVVPIDFEPPKNILCHVLDEVYLAEHDPATKSGADGVDWAAVEREAFLMTGNGELLEYGASVTKGGSGSGPSGRVTILDPSYDTEPVGVAGVKVCCNVFVKVARAYTDDEGYYQMDKSFSAKPRYRIEFQNRKGFCIGFNFILVRASVSSFGKQSPAGFDMKVTSQSERKLFLRCAANNAAYEYVCKCTSGASRISNPPANTRIWIMDGLASSCAPMFQQGTTVDNGLLYDYLGAYSEIVKMFLPDVVLGTKGMTSYAEVYHTTVHEFAHASHFMAVGIPFWNKYIRFMMVSYVTTGGILYGAGTEVDSGYAAVGEMWAYYLENRMFKERYPSLTASFGFSNWFHPQVFSYLDDRGVDRYKIFAALGPDVFTVDKLRERMLSLYPEFKSTINEAFLRYL